MITFVVLALISSGCSSLVPPTPGQELQDHPVYEPTIQPGPGPYGALFYGIYFWLVDPEAYHWFGKTDSGNNSNSDHQ